MRSTLLLAAVAVAALPSAAHAATVQLNTVGHTEGHQPGLIRDGVAITYTAAPGEANRFTIALLGDRLLISDTGATIQPIAAPPDDTAGQCTAVDATSVTCPFPLGLRAALGDADDVATVGALGTGRIDAIEIDGGSGADVLTGGVRAETLIAGDGADRVTGGDGDDHILAAETSAANDTFDGGPGRDVLDYVKQQGDITLNVATGRASGPTIGTDRFAAFEEHHGGRGDDELVGDDAPNFLAGGPGDDFLRGEAGDDTLWGELPDAVGPATRDRIDGGAGDDAIELGKGWIDPGDLELTIQQIPDGDPDRVRCSGGVDEVSYADPLDVIPADCEIVGSDTSSLRLPPLRATTRTLTLRASGYGKHAVVRDARTHAVLGRFARKVPKGVEFALTPAGRRIAQTGRAVVVSLGDLTVTLTKL